VADPDDLDGIVAELQLTSEALRIVSGILDDLLDRIPDLDRSEYEGDLARLQQIAALTS
jgi:hypothetical protein